VLTEKGLTRSERENRGAADADRLTPSLAMPAIGFGFGVAGVEIGQYPPKLAAVACCDAQRQGCQRGLVRVGANPVPENRIRLVA